MKRSPSNLVTDLFSTENRSKRFYLLALVPFLLMSYSYIRSPLGLVIPLYGLILLVLKKDKLFSHPEAHAVQKLFGLLVVFVSFFVYFVVSPFFPTAVFYGFANYFVYLIGLFLVFFEIQALKEAFSPLFLIVAFVSNSYISDLAESFFTPYLPHFTSFIAAVLRAIGIAATLSLSNPNVIVLHTSNGPISLMNAWACVGFTSMYVFSIILVVILSEDPSDAKTKVRWSIIGVLGIFFVNIIRVVTVFVGYYFYGYELGGRLHSSMGYVLFIAWTVIFLYLFSKRNVISQKIRIVYAKIWKSAPRG